MQDHAPEPLSGGRVRRRTWVPFLVSLATALVVLGPTLGRGVVIAHDLVWSPRPVLSPFVLGISTPAPRAVPGETVAALLGMVLGSSLSQKLLLLAVLVGAGSGAARLVGDLVPVAGATARSVAAVAAIWNAFVAERLVIGQWAVLVGLAALPWALSGVLRLHRGGSIRGVLGALVVAGLAGYNAWIVVGLAVLPSLLALRARWRDTTVAGLVWVGMAAVWAVPALVAGVRGGSSGGQAFRPTSDTAFGPVVSLLSGGGFWNTASHPAAREVALLALAATALALVAGTYAVRRVGAVSAVLAGSLLIGPLVAVASALPVLDPVWTHVIGWPGGVVLRDSQKLVATWVVLVAVGAGLLADRVRRTSFRAAAPLVAALLAGMQVAVLPTIAWGVGGRLTAVEVPAAMARAAAVVDDLPPTTVGILPWNQYRRYPWNGERISLTLMPRMIDQVTLYDDSLPLRSGRVAGEDPRADAVTAALDAGTSAEDALRAHGVSVVVVEKSAGLSDTPLVGDVLLDTAEVTVIRIAPDRVPADRVTVPVLLGWCVTILTAVATLVLALTGRVLRNAKSPLLRSGP